MLQIFNIISTEFVLSPSCLFTPARLNLELSAVLIFAFSTKEEPWTGIYTCKNPAHQDQFYCGKGKCSFDKKKKLLTCDDESWDSHDKPLMLGNNYFNSPSNFNLFLYLILCRYAQISTSKDFKMKWFPDHFAMNLLFLLSTTSMLKSESRKKEMTKEMRKLKRMTMINLAC